MFSMHVIKKTAAAILITSVVFLVFIAILSIWDVLAKDVFWKSLSTIGVIAFGSAIIIATTQAMEQKVTKNTDTPTRVQ